MTYITDAILKLQSMNMDELSKHLSARAHKNEVIKYAFIRTTAEYRLTKDFIKALNEIIKGYRITREACYRSYVDKVKQGTNLDADLSLLLSVKHYDRCIEFYTEEVYQLIDLLDEFKTYITNGHILKWIFAAIDRTEEEMFDHRLKFFRYK